MSLRLSHTFRQEIEIEASAQVVWNVLSDFGRYPEWHPFTPRVDIDPRLGGRIRQEVNMFQGKDRIIHKARVTQWDDQKIMGWRMAYPPLVWAERTQTITEARPGVIRYMTTDLNHGLLVPWIVRKYGRAIEEGFAATAKALKERCEKQPI